MLQSIRLVVMGFYCYNQCVYIYVSYISSDEVPGASELSVQRPH